MILKLILTCFCWIAVLPIIYGLNFGERYISTAMFEYNTSIQARKDGYL